jgi:uncharacterized membrane protein
VQIAAAVFCTLSVITFVNTVRAYNKDGITISKYSLWALMAATIFGATMVALFYIFGTMVLLRKTVSETGLNYSYGALHISCIWAAILTLLCAVSIHGFRDDMKMWERTGPGMIPKSFFAR